MEYRSSMSFLGLPLLHVATSSVVDGRYRRGVATAWVAVGDMAFGVLFAFGGVAVGGLSVGGAAFGLFPFGGLALGALAIGGLALGAIAVGGAAIAWYAAVGGLAIAGEYAIGGVALARHVLGPLVSKAPLWASIPQAPFHWADAVALAVIVVALVVIAVYISKRQQSNAH